MECKSITDIHVMFLCQTVMTYVSISPHGSGARIYSLVNRKGILSRDSHQNTVSFYKTVWRYLNQPVWACKDTHGSYRNRVDKQHANEATL